MKDQFVTYQIANKLKAVNFDEPCLGKFNLLNQYLRLFNDGNFYKNSNCSLNDLTAPLWQQVIDWFREKYDIVISIVPIPLYLHAENYLFMWQILGYKELGEKDENNGGYSYLEAREVAILKAIEVLKSGLILKL
jgi:hypothetical protein